MAKVNQSEVLESCEWEVMVTSPWASRRRQDPYRQRTSPCRLP